MTVASDLLLREAIISRRPEYRVYRIRYGGSAMRTCILILLSMSIGIRHWEIMIMEGIFRHRSTIQISVAAGKCLRLIILWSGHVMMSVSGL